MKPVSRISLLIAGLITETQAAQKNVLFIAVEGLNDEKLTRDEFLAGQPNAEQAAKRLTRLDRDNDGILTRQEFVSAGN